MPQSEITNPQSAIVIGGGLAGLASAVGLAQHGVRVTVLESRNRLGGRAGSFTDANTGQMVDACQHVSMGCCTNLTHLLRTVGVEHLLAPQPKLYFVTPDGRTSLFKADPWPAPFHLGRALTGAHYLTPLDKLRVAYGLARMLCESPSADPPLLPWLRKHWQNDRTIQRFWGIVLTSALNETVERVGLKYARKVFRDGFVRHRDAFTVHVPRVPLGRLYGDELRTWLTAHGVELRENAGVKRVVLAEEPTPPAPPSLKGRGEKSLDDSVASTVRGGFIPPLPFREGGPGGVGRPVRALELRDGSSLSADWYVLAVPFDRVVDLLPPELVAREPYFAAPGNLKPSPITSVHLWLDRPTLRLPHAVLVDCLSQWVFDRGEVAPGEYYLQVVVSAARNLGNHADIQHAVLDELTRVFPAIGKAKLLRARVVTERTATFSAVPGVDRWRVPQASPVGNLAVAGDWTDTGWPATMEGAVRSGYLAAEAILTRAGRPAKLLRPDL